MEYMGQQDEIGNKEFGSEARRPMFIYQIPYKSLSSLDLALSFLQIRLKTCPAMLSDC